MTTTSLEVGQDAPKFKATATDGSIISLDDFKENSNVILYFYPEDMTSGCTVEACNFRDDKSKYDAGNTVILGVSMDNQKNHQEFTEKDRLNFPLLVDTDGLICKLYGVPLEDGQYPHRWTYLINKHGKIARIWEKVVVRTHSEELLRVISELPK